MIAQQQCMLIPVDERRCAANKQMANGGDHDGDSMRAAFGGDSMQPVVEIQCAQVEQNEAKC